MDGNDRIAIVGMSGLFPGAPTLEQFWQNIVERVDASTDVPPGRWCVPPQRALSPKVVGLDQVVSTRGYFLDDFSPDLTGLNVDPGLVERLDVVFQLALHIGNRAFRSARMSAVESRRVGVILGSIALPTDRISDLAFQLATGREPTVEPLNRHVTGLPAVLLAQGLGLGGTAYTLDAACASSLYAIKLAGDELLSGRADAMLAGGISRPDCLYTQMGFSQLRALSPSGRCSPFDAAADGLMVGEGGGIFVLKRLQDALSHGDAILAVIAGCGLSNDIDGNVLAPASEGQLRAMRAAYQYAGWSPADVDLIECHATGTPLGDLTEFNSLRELWRADGRERTCVVGSVKSNVGHLLTGANAAGLGKVLLAMRHQSLPPAANLDRAASGIDFTNTPFRSLRTAQPWARRSAVTPRRAAISGFGFGGINAHLLVEEWLGQETTKRPVPKPCSIAITRAAAHFGDLDSRPKTTAAFFAESATRQRLAIDEIGVPLGAFPLPPKEMVEMLPQQLLLLKVGRDAMRGEDKAASVRTGVLIGVELDINTTNFHVRWQAGEKFLSLGEADQRRALDAAIPPLTANRTLGALASVAASRVARTFHCGGPSFTISSGPASGVHALQVAVDLLQNGEIDRAIVGAVSLNADPRLSAFRRDAEPGDGACALIVKRLEDAENNGDEILAVIDEDVADGLYLDTADAAAAPAVIRVENAIGDCGAASGLAAVLRALEALFQRVLPARQNGAKPQYWLHDTARGPRRAQIKVESWHGFGCAIGLREASARPFKPNRIETTVAPFLLAARTEAELRAEMRQLAALLTGARLTDVAGQLREQSTRSVEGDWRAAFVCENPDVLRRAIDDCLAQPELSNYTVEGKDLTVLVRVVDKTRRGELAFVFPGSGNHFADMGRELGLTFPGILERQQAENSFLRSQYAADEFWNGGPVDQIHPRKILFAQVSCGTLLCDLLRSFGVEPDVVLGYSLGESASLFGMRVWADRDGMLQRLQSSTLFASDLAHPFRSARACWGWSDSRPIDWITGVLQAPAPVAAAAIERDEKAYVLIVNTPTECVLGGDRLSVEAVVKRLRKPFWEIAGVTTAHCEAASPVRERYWELHHLPVVKPRARFYSGADHRQYEVTSDSAADAILAAVLHQIDFPQLVEAAYRDGVRTFVEIGPGGSCTRMIDAILRDRPHRALPLHVRHEKAVQTFLNALAQLHVAGIAVDLSPFFQSPVSENHIPPGKTMHLPVRSCLPCVETLTVDAAVADEPVKIISCASNHFVDAVQSITAVAEAHETFLRFSNTTYERLAETIALQTNILNEMVGGGNVLPPAAMLSGRVLDAPEELHEAAAAVDGVPRSLSLAQCQEFAAGSVANVLGPAFAGADAFPTRVRLPDGPLMLVDRVLRIEGEPLSLTSGRVITEHQVHDKRWYLDGGCMPVCVTVEAGQADLFLSGFLGIDFITRGLAVYRLLDAAITFHRRLPRIGERIEYDIHIDRFFKQGETHLFRFRFEGTIDGEPLISMTDGCAGFFTNEHLASGKGIVKTALDRQPLPGKRPDGWRALAPMHRQTLSTRQIDSLRQGDLVGAFGAAFEGLPLAAPQRLPGGMLQLVDRVVELDPDGGRFGLGLIRAEADIQPDDWFLTCHFVDDMVMPGTLMYECCLHTLRIYLMRMGWVGEENEVICQPLEGVASRLKCRGQVTASTRVAAYEVVIKEIGYNPEPYVIADALMYADGRPIVEMSNMSMRLQGLHRAQVETMWDNRNLASGRVLFDRDRILAFAIGRPSEAFGDAYRVFDHERVIARLPGPPYQFLDRITRIEAEPWKMVAGGVIEAEYDVPPDEWYFAANRAPRMPFSVLLEVALQPCGWLAAYVGSALTSPTDLSFRNLGGKAIQHAGVSPRAGTLRTTVKLTRVSNSAGMIIQHYDYSVQCRDDLIFAGDTYFGFFSKQALANQVGLREISLYLPSEAEKTRAWSGGYPTQPPYPDQMLRMVDRVNWYVEDGGPHGLGAIEGSIKVDPSAWFFKAHFYQDPVWPGSLGLESFVQIAKFMAASRWQVPVDRLVVPSGGRPHRWTYRGQVIPADSEVTVQAYIKNASDRDRQLVVDGLLCVDGRIIYQMNDFLLTDLEAGVE